MSCQQSKMLHVLGVIQQWSLQTEVLPRRAGARWAADWRRTWRCLQAPLASRQGAEGHSDWVLLSVTRPLKPSSSSLTSKRTSQKMFPPSRPVLLGHKGRRQRRKHSAERQRSLWKHNSVRKGSPGMSLECSQHLYWVHLKLIWLEPERVQVE